MFSLGASQIEGQQFYVLSFSIGCGTPMSSHFTYTRGAIYIDLINVERWFSQLHYLAEDVSPYTSFLNTMSSNPSDNDKSATADAEARYAASCLCGQIAYEIVGQPTFVTLCHCTNCSKWSGAGSAWNVAFSPEASSVSARPFFLCELT